MIEVLIELAIYLVFEIILEGAFEIGGRGVVAAFRKTESNHPVMTILLYVCMGLVAGTISLWLVPNHLVKSHTLQILGILITPIVLGCLFEAFGRLRTRQAKRRYIADRFSYGFTFAVAMGLVRHVFAG